MKRSRRVIALNMFWSLLSLCINYLMNFLITPYVTNNIGVEAYGFVALANTFISYVDILAVGLNAFAGRFIAMAYYQKKLEKANRYFSSTILADLILACVLLAGGTVAIVRLDRMLQIPQELTADVKLLFFIVLMRYLLTLLRTAFDAAAFISERIDLAEKLQSAAYLLQAGLLLALCLLLQPHVWYVGLAAAVDFWYFTWSRNIRPPCARPCRSCFISRSALKTVARGSSTMRPRRSRHYESCYHGRRPRHPHRRAGRGSPQADAAH